MTAIAYPVPLDAWEAFRPNVEQFCGTWRQFAPGAPCILYALCCQSDPDSEVKEVFSGLPVEFCRYDGAGCDIGAHQHLAFQIGETFQVSMSTRTFFHREGWLAKILESRAYFGPGLFGTAVSKETGMLHFRTHCYAMDAGYFRRYPHLINTRSLTFDFEHGAHHHPSGSLLNWAKAQGDMAVACVYWDGGWREHEWFDRQEIFRTGNQSNLLVFDRHTEIFRDYTQTEKDYWRSLAFTGAPPVIQTPEPPPKPAAKCCGH